MRSAYRVSSSNGGALAIAKRYSSRLYTNYYAGQRFPNQMVVPKVRLPAGVTVSGAMNGKQSLAEGETLKASGGQQQQPPQGVSWDDAESTDIVHANSAGGAQAEVAVPRERRPYVPLGEVAKLELQGDYLMEGGLFQEALEFYGVVAKAYELAYPENHSQVAGILIKLGAAFRQTERLESARQNLERAVAMLDASPSPSLELIVEALLELGLTLELLDDAGAGKAYEDAVNVVDGYHNYGQSHRMLRLLPRLGRRYNTNQEEKFLYYSPFDYDRTFALADQCLERAERFYKDRADTESTIRVLQLRKEMIDKKFFNMRDFSGRIRTMRGHWKRRGHVLSNAPTPDDLLRYSPTIHQVHRDFRYELNAPIGRESEVQPGVNRVALDMGSPYRKRGERAKRMMRDADYNYERYVKGKELN